MWAFTSSSERFDNDFNSYPGELERARLCCWNSGEVLFMCWKGLMLWWGREKKKSSQRKQCFLRRLQLLWCWQRAFLSVTMSKTAAAETRLAHRSHWTVSRCRYGIRGLVSPHFEILAVDLNSAVLALPPRLYRRYCNVKTNNNFDLSLTFFVYQQDEDMLTLATLALVYHFQV